MSASVKFAKQASFAFAKAATIMVLVAGSAACSQYAQSARADATAQAPAIDAALIDSVSNAQQHYQRQNAEWENLLAHGTDQALFETHLESFGASAMNVQKDLAQTQKLMRGMHLSTQKLDALKAMHQDMVMRQFEAFHAHYDKTGADSSAPRKVEDAVAGANAAFLAAINAFAASIAQGTHTLG